MARASDEEDSMLPLERIASGLGESSCPLDLTNRSHVNDRGCSFDSDSDSNRRSDESQTKDLRLENDEDVTDAMVMWRVRISVHADRMRRLDLNTHLEIEGEVSRLLFLTVVRMVMSDDGRHHRIMK